GRALGARERLGVELRWAFEKVGFYYLRGHGISQSLIDATLISPTPGKRAGSCEIRRVPPRALAASMRHARSGGTYPVDLLARGTRTAGCPSRDESAAAGSCDPGAPRGGVESPLMATSTWPDQRKSGGPDATPEASGTADITLVGAASDIAARRRVSSPLSAPAVARRVESQTVRRENRTLSRLVGSRSHVVRIASRDPADGK